MTEEKTKALAHPQGLREVLRMPSVIERFADIRGSKEFAQEYLASLLSVANQSKGLLNCSHSSVLTAAAKAAVLRLPIEPALGYAYIVPYKREATFILGYKGMIQLAIRTGSYKTINTSALYNGEDVVTNRMSGLFEIVGDQITDEEIGYFAMCISLRRGS